MKPLPERPQWETIPKGTRPSRCRGEACGAEVYWIERPSRRKPKPGEKGKPATVRIPVDVDVPGGSAPDSLSDGRGVSHFQTCAEVEKF